MSSLGLVVMPIAVTAMMGYNNIIGIVAVVERVERIDRLARLTHSARMAEKDYLRHGTAEHLDEADRVAADARTECDSLKTEFRAKSNRQAVDEIRQQFGVWHAALGRCAAAETDELRAAAEAETTEAARRLDQSVTQLKDQYAITGQRIGETTATTLLIVAAMSIFPCLFIWLLLGRLILRQLSKCVTTANALADGDFSARCDVIAKNELGQLADALNRAGDTIQAALGEANGPAERQPVACADGE